MIEPYTLIPKLPAHALRSLAMFYESMARDFLAAAELAEKKDQKKVEMKARKKRIFDAEEMILSYLTHGHSQDSAVATVASMTGIDEKVLLTVLPKAKKSTVVERRNREIMLLREQGRSLEQIGEVVQLHPKSVSRIIKDIQAA